MELEQSKNNTENQNDKNEPKYIVLPNQGIHSSWLNQTHDPPLGATCYMNSLLQSLFMTPEFRSAMYEWK